MTVSSGSSGSASSRRRYLPNDWLFRLQDILDAVERIDDFVAGLPYDDFIDDRKTIDAVVRNIEIIGEAAGYVPEEVQRQHPEIPWSRMRGMRNVIIHRYNEVSLPILWQTIHANLPPLVPLLTAMIEEG